MAIRVPATAHIRGRSGPTPLRPWICACAFALLALAAGPALAQSNNVRLTKLSDVPFGTITNFGADSVSSQSVCLYSSSATNGYNVTGQGSGAGNAFTMASGLQTLAYDVQWSDSSGQSAGSQLTANTPLTGQISTATHKTCNNGPTTTASLIVILRASALSRATAGAYSGTLTLLIGPE